MSASAPPREAIAARLRGGELTSAALTKAYLDRIERLDGAVHSYVTVTGESALARAQAADEAFTRGGPIGPLHGLPIAVKDNIDTAGVRTTAGSRFFERHVPDRSATVVERLLAAGAVVLGKTTLHEFAYGATTQNPHYGCCRNPWDLRRIPGGSSGGSGAALGADLCAAALGTDTGGSVRIPAALNGATGLRPTSGRVSAHGVFPVSWTLDTVGPMARSALDVADVFEAIAGYDAADPGSVAAPPSPSEAGDGLRGVTVGVPRSFFFDDLDPEVGSAVRAGADTLSALGAIVEEVELAGAANAIGIATQMIWAEAFAVHRQRLDEDPERFGEDVRRRLDSGRSVSGADYALLRQEARVWARTVTELLSRVDLVLTPVTAIVAPFAEGAEMIETTRQLTRFTYGWSLAGVPALALPCGFSTDGMPIGMQVAAAPWRDRMLLDVGAAFQETTDWHTREPSLEAIVSAGGG